MKNNDQLQLLPEKYYIGSSISKDQFIRKAAKTDRNSSDMRFFCKGEITIMYSVNSQNSNLKANSEIHILLVPVAVRNLKLDAVKSIAIAIQRGIPYRIIIILSNGDFYKVVIPESHRGIKNDSFIVDDVLSSRWENFEGLKNLFSNFSPELKRSDYDFNKLWQAVRHLVIEDSVERFREDPYATDEEFLEQPFIPVTFNNHNGVRFLLKTLNEEDISPLITGYLPLTQYERQSYSSTVFSMTCANSEDSFSARGIPIFDSQDIAVYIAIKVKEAIGDRNYKKISASFESWLKYWIEDKLPEDLCDLFENQSIDYENSLEEDDEDFDDEEYEFSELF